MADNLGYTEGGGSSVATDDIAGVHYQRIKMGFGDDGEYADVSVSNPLPTTDDTIIALLAAMLERMPRVTGNDQCAVSIEGGSVGIAANQTLAALTTLSNITSIGSKPASTAADAISMTGAAHIYNNIIVS